MKVICQIFLFFYILSQNLVFDNRSQHSDVEKKREREKERKEQQSAIQKKRRRRSKQERT
jgi:hypothetical protein